MHLEDGHGWLAMPKSDKVLVILLRIVGVGSLFALVAVFMPVSWMVCSAGIAAGIDMSLHVVSRLLGREVAEQTARQMEYP
jgi:hypothetical protein